MTNANTNTALRKHLCNVIYIENNFGLDLFKSKAEAEQVETEDFEDALMMRQPLSHTINPIADVETEIDNKVDSISTFFGTIQRNTPDMNILPYYYDSNEFERHMDCLKKKLSHFPLVIIDWQLEDKKEGKTGIDVFESIIQDNEMLHYYVMYSNEIGSAVSAFSEKFATVKMGEIKENGVVMIENAIVMFANKRTKNINDIIDTLEKFTIDNYGYLPQLFLNIKQQIENKTASLYDDFMALDSMMLPQLIADEAYNYVGLEDELLKTFIMNKLRDDLKITDNSSGSYIKNSIIRLLKKEVTSESFEKALEICNRTKEKKLDLTLEQYKDRCTQILKFNYMDLDLLPALKLAAYMFVNGTKCTIKPDEITTLSNGDRDKIYTLVLLVSICNDDEFLSNYVKLYKIIKLSEYKDERRFGLEECFTASKGNVICQGDVFIDDDNNYLLCVSPSCQLMRPKKINYHYTFLKGCIDSSAHENQKQFYEISLLNKEMDKVVPVKLSFYDPVIIDMNDSSHMDCYRKYVRVFSLHMEYIHKVVELFSEYIKQIGVEELFGKKAEIKDIFINNMRGIQNDSD